MDQEGAFGMEYLKGYFEHYKDKLTVVLVNPANREYQVRRKGDPDNVYFTVGYTPNTEDFRFNLKLGIVVLGEGFPRYYIYRRSIEQKNSLEGLKHIARQLEIHFGETLRPERVPAVDLLERAALLTKERMADRKGRVDLVFSDDEFGHSWSYSIIDDATNLVLADNLATNLPDHVYWQLFSNASKHYRFGVASGTKVVVQRQTIAACEQLNLNVREYMEWSLRNFLLENPIFLEQVYQEHRDPSMRPLKHLN